jgi:SNF2 family DNA or RNA helicase
MIKIDYDGEFKLSLKKEVPEYVSKLDNIEGVTFNGNNWTIIKNKAVIRNVINEFGKNNVKPTEAAYDKMMELKNSVLLDYDGSVFEVYTSFNNKNRNFFKYHIGKCYKRTSKGCWSVPDNYWSIYHVMKHFDLDYSPAAKKRLDKYQEKIGKINNNLLPKLNTIKDVDVDRVPIDHNFKGQFELYEHQKKMFWSAKEFLKIGAGFAFFAEPGVGKSAPAVNVVEYMLENNLVEKVLIVTPASLKFNMAEQFETHSSLRANVLLSYAKDQRKGKSGRRWQWTTAKVPIEEYYEGFNEKLDNEVDSPIQIVNYKCVAKEWKKFKDYDMWVADEFHYLKRRTSNRSKGMAKLSDHVPKRLALTATPITRDPLDLFSQFDILDPDVFPNRYQNFRDKIANTFEMKVNGRNITQVGSFKQNILEGWLNDKVYSRAIRYTTDECLELMEPERHRIVVDMPSNVKKFYKELVTNRVAEIGSMGDEGYKFLDAANSLVVVTYARQIAQGFINIKDDETGEDEYHLLSDFKVKELIKLLKVFEEHTQIIIWYRHKYLLEQVKRSLEKEFKRKSSELYGKSYTVINGEYDDLKKASRAKHFRDGEYDYILASIDVTEGWQGQTANVGIWLENHFTFDKRKQAEGRIYREGQQGSSDFYDIVAKESIDLRILKSIYKGESLSEKVLADTIDEWSGF